MKYLLIAPINTFILIALFLTLVFQELGSLFWNFKFFKRYHNNLKWSTFKEVDYKNFFTQFILKMN